MPIAVAVMVGRGDIRVRRSSGLLTCVGLRSGACACLYDPATLVAGMAHITDLEPDSASPSRPGKYPGSGIEALIEAMERTGAHRGRIVAALSGGALEVVHGAEDDVKTVESRVCRAVLLELDRQGITLVASETGGREDRSTTLDPATGIVQVKWQSTGSQVLCDLKNGKAPSTAWQDLLASTRRTDNSPVWSPEPAKVLSA